MSPIMQQFREIETCIECSAFKHIQVCSNGSSIFKFCCFLVCHCFVKTCTIWCVAFLHTLLCVFGLAPNDWGLVYCISHIYMNYLCVTFAKVLFNGYQGSSFNRWLYVASIFCYFGIDTVILWLYTIKRFVFSDSWGLLLCTKSCSSSNRPIIRSGNTDFEGPMCASLEADFHSLWSWQGWCPQWCRVEWFPGHLFMFFKVLVFYVIFWYDLMAIFSNLLSSIHGNLFLRFMNISMLIVNRLNVSMLHCNLLR